MLKSFIYSILLLLSPLLAFSQSYELLSYQGEYTVIEDFNSIIIETGSPHFLGSFRIDLDFEFPFFDSSYDFIYVGSDGQYGFEGEGDLYLQLYSIVYDFGEDLNIFDPQSDVRYKLTEENGLKCLVFQYTKVRFIGDPSVEEFDSYLNFQNWFFEDGSMEVRIGKMNLDNSPGFTPGEGYFLIFNNGDLLIPVYVGIGIARLNFEDGIYLSGTHDDFEVTDYYDTTGVGIKSLPPEGWVFRFEPEPTAVNEIAKKEFVLYPNPVEGELFMDIGSQNASHIEIMDILGRRVHFQSLIEKKVDLSHLLPGIYLARVRIENRDIVRPIIKK